VVASNPQLAKPGNKNSCTLNHTQTRKTSNENNLFYCIVLSSKIMCCSGQLTCPVTCTSMNKLFQRGSSRGIMYCARNASCYIIFCK
jgi:hypothetical protein